MSEPKEMSPADRGESTTPESTITTRVPAWLRDVSLFVFGGALALALHGGLHYGDIFLIGVWAVVFCFCVLFCAIPVLFGESLDS